MGPFGVAEAVFQTGFNNSACYCLKMFKSWMQILSNLDHHHHWRGPNFVVASRLGALDQSYFLKLEAKPKQEEGLMYPVACDLSSLLEKRGANCWLRSIGFGFSLPVEKKPLPVFDLLSLWSVKISHFN
ncbi:hypothetical protein T10_2785 [Trichinella papuae]|uniref:Uncharacterized protein n=1 Tax=Trichinella papuae TaxID=268474 RepID=A0A0V1MSU5_9BILA|nr:hypothetical protein T10_2785 [Trichinella papuae]